MTGPPFSSTAAEVMALRTENARLRRLLDLTAEQARPPAAAQTGLFLDRPGPVTATSFGPDKLRSFRALFAARTDVYAIRWDNARTGRSGWSPAVEGGWRKGTTRPYLRLTDRTLKAVNGSPPGGRWWRELVRAPVADAVPDADRAAGVTDVAPGEAGSPAGGGVGQGRPVKVGVMRLLVPAVTTLNLLAAALAAGWLTGLVVPPPLDAPALLVLPHPVAAWSVLVTGLVGVVLPAALPRALLPAAALGLAVFGLALQSITTIALAGYLLALALPLIWWCWPCRRSDATRGSGSRLRSPPSSPSGGASPPDPGSTIWAGNWRAASSPRRPERAWRFTAIAVGWALLVIDAVKGTAVAGRLTEVVVRHRRLFTVLAALGPLPYVLVRVTWLTPWPQLGGPITGVTPETRLWGVLLGGAALLGSVLTVGLIRPWAEVFPRWVPWSAGRPVPVALAAVPGGVVAAALCVSAVPVGRYCGVCPDQPIICGTRAGAGTRSAIGKVWDGREAGVSAAGQRDRRRTASRLGGRRAADGAAAGSSGRSRPATRPGRLPGGRPASR